MEGCREIILGHRVRSGRDSEMDQSICASEMELGQWVIWVIFHVRVIILTRREARVFFRFFLKKAQDKDIKIYIFVTIRPAVIETLTFNK